jgi:hypothetical protein
MKAKRAAAAAAAEVTAPLTGEEEMDALLRKPRGTRSVTLAALMHHEDKVQEFRERAAQIAVDMERGIFMSRSRKADHHMEPWSGPYSRPTIAHTIGFNMANGKLPKCLRSPEFERAVEWERIRRDAAYRITLKEAAPQLDVVMGGFLREAQRRVLTKRVETIDDRTVFGELRRLFELKSGIESANDPRGANVQQTVNDFRTQILLLPPEAQETAMALFRQQLARLSSAAAVIDVEMTKTGELAAAVAS